MPRTAPPTVEPAPPPPRRRTGRGRWLAGGAVLLAAAVWFAPGVLLGAGGPWGANAAGGLVAKFLPDLPGTVTAAVDSAGWTRPVALRDVVWTDADGTVLLTAEAVRTERTLFDLAGGALRPADPAGRDHGTITLVRPHLAAAVAAGGSDWETALAPLVAALSGGGDGPPPRFTVAVEAGTAEVRSAGGTLLSRGVTGTVAVRGDAPPAVNLTGEVGDGETWGSVAVTGGDATLTTVALIDLPLAALVPLADRFDPGWSPAGRVTGEWTVSPAAAPRVDGRLRGTRVSLRHAAWPGADRLVLGDAELAGGAAFGPSFTLDTLRLAGDPGRVVIGGAAGDGAGVEPSADLRATLDLAELARQFPATLRLRDGLRPTGGTLELKGRVRPGGELAGAVRVSDLSATLAGRAVTWPRPVSASAALGRTADGPRLTSLRVTSDVLAVSGKPRGDGFAASFRCDLAALREATGRFADLDGVTLAGVATGELAVSADGPARLGTALAGTVREFAFAPSPASGVWREREVELTGSATFALPRSRGVATPRLSSREIRVESADASLASAGDTLRATLIGGWDPLDPFAPLLADVAVAGDAGRWLDRAGSSGGGPQSGVRVRGDANGTARVTLAGPLVAVDDLDLTVTPLSVRGPGVNLSEPAANVTGGVVFDRLRGSLRGGTLTWRSRSLAVRGTNFHLTPTPQADASASAPTASSRLGGQGVEKLERGRFGGRVEARGAIGRVAGWFRDAATPAATWLSGTFDADLTLADRGGVPTLGGSLDLTEPTLSARDDRGGWDAVWRDGRASAAGTLSLTGDAVRTDDFTASVAGLSLTAAGAVTDLLGTPTADLAGRWTPDWDVLSGREPLRGWSIAGRGGDERGWRLRGPLAAGGAGGVPAGLFAEAGLAWDDLRIVGLEFGPGTSLAVLERGELRFAGPDGRSPLDVAAYGGRLTTVPTLALNTPSVTLRLPPGPTLRDVRLTPELSRRWPGFVAPLAANATELRGRASLDLAEPAVIPLSSPRSATAAGTVRTDEITLAPGSTGGEVLGVVARIRKLLGRETRGAGDAVTLPPQTVPFRVAGGRVLHDRLTLNRGSVRVETGGAVAFDGRLDLVATVSLPDEGDAKALPRLAGRPVRVPVRGTLSRPEVDPAAVAELGTRMGAGAAEDFLRDNVRKGFGKLLGRP